MHEAERIIRTQYPEITRIAVIAGVGVRAYYEKLGYSERDEYMCKEFD